LDNIRIFGLSRLDSLDLKKKFPDARITFEPGTTKDPQHGELVTVALVALTVAGLNVLAAVLLKDRNRGKIEKTIEIINADGSRRTETIVMEVSESTSHADVVKALAPQIGVDLSKLQGS